MSTRRNRFSVTKISACFSSQPFPDVRFRSNRPKAQKGKPIRAAQINAPDRLLTQLSKLRGGRGTFWTPFGPQIDQPSSGIFRVGITGSDGIPATNESEGSGSTTLGYSADVSDCYIAVSQPGTAILTVTGQDFDGYNLSSQPVGPNAITIYMFLWNIWICIWEDCSS